MGLTRRRTSERCQRQIAKMSIIDSRGICKMTQFDKTRPFSISPQNFFLTPRQVRQIYLFSCILETIATR